MTTKIYRVSNIALLLILFIHLVPRDSISVSTGFSVFFLGVLGISSAFLFENN